MGDLHRHRMVGERRAVELDANLHGERRRRRVDQARAAGFAVLVTEAGDGELHRVIGVRGGRHPYGEQRSHCEQQAPPCNHPT